ncbi:MAG: phosphatidylserine/phosphatidylglycerophosphate/cardiolipin synthase family protein [Bacteriovorax sp.]|nr:phosphatidylserine/phosphatidylglycerophosphate/cardiolipin synthase family protein [Bacteriovorax sp.]
MPKFKKSIITGLLISSSLVLSLVSPLHAKVYDFTEDNKLTLLQDARAAVELKLDLVRHAKNHIHIMTYYWDKKGYPIELIRELKKAHERGVDVRIMTTYIPSLTMDFWGKSKKELFAGYDKNNSSAVLAYMRMAPGNNESITNNIHEKVFLVDGEKAILGGRNISDNDFRAKDLEVMLEGEIVNQVQEHFKKMFSFLIDLKIGNDCKKKKVDCLAKFNKLKFADEDKKFFPEQPHYAGGARARILTNEILFDQHQNHYSGDARFTVKDDIIDTIININFTKMRGYNYFIIPTERYKNYLEKNLAEGKSIDIITNSITTAAAISNKGYLYGLPEMHNLVGLGLNLHQWLGTKQEEGKDKLFYLHEKVMLFDDDHGIIGSHNFGAGSTSVSSEISVEFFSRPIVQVLNEVFDSEKNSSELTKEATLPLLESEIHDNLKMIRLLHAAIIRNIVKELY